MTVAGPNIESASWRHSRARFVLGVLAAFAVATIASAQEDRAVFGSTRASEFFRDLRDKRDSLDIVTIGDSNAGYPLAGGWNLGLINACLNQRFDAYASPLKIEMQNMGWPIPETGPWLNWSQDIVGPSGNLRSGANDGPAEISALCVPHTTLRPQAGVGVDWAYVAPMKSVHSVMPLEDSDGPPPFGSWCEPGTPLIFRVVYPTFPSGSGSISPVVWNYTSHSEIAQAPVTSTNAGAYGLASVETPFVMPSGARVVAGWNYVNAAVGPAGAVYESIYRARKGFSGTNIYYFGGSTVTTMSADISGAGSAFWATYFGELISRQQAAGGSGRILVWMNGGINGPSNYTQWAAGMEAMIDAITAGFIWAGGSLDNLAILCSVTHPTNAAELAAAESVLSDVRTQAETWVDTLQDGVTYLNLAKVYSADQMLANGWYAGGGGNQAHMNESGYFAFANAIIGLLLEYPHVPCPCDLNGDGEVDSADLGLVLLNFGATTPVSPYDLDGNGAVDSADLGLVLLNFDTSEPDSPYDLDGNGVVDSADLGLVLLNFDTTTPSLPLDLDGNGEIDAADLGLVLLNFGPCP